MPPGVTTNTWEKQHDKSIETRKSKAVSVKSRYLFGCCSKGAVYWYRLFSRSSDFVANWWPYDAASIAPGPPLISHSYQKPSLFFFASSTTFLVDKSSGLIRRDPKVPHENRPSFTIERFFYLWDRHYRAFSWDMVYCIFFSCICSSSLFRK